MTGPYRSGIECKGFIMLFGFLITFIFLIIILAAAGGFTFLLIILSRKDFGEENNFVVKSFLFIFLAVVALGIISFVFMLFFQYL